MKEIVIISGKGGTGKTSVTASFAALASNSVFADCDVDAADLHLILKPQIEETKDFMSGVEAEIDASKCIACGKCKEICRFDAIKEGKTYFVNPLDCEGCGVCAGFCPVNSIALKERKCGQWFVSDTRFGKLVHARLDIGAENSGKLVSTVRAKAREIAVNSNADYLLIDGPPGIGCSVIASITGADAVVAITEPTLSGQHDLKRVAELTKHFQIPLLVCINKFDINPELSDLIETEATESSATILGRISYGREVTAAQLSGKSVVEFSDSKVSKEIKQIWENLCRNL